MPVAIRPAETADIAAMAPLLVEDAEARAQHDPTLWPLASEAQDKVKTALAAALSPDPAPVRQSWFVADTDGVIVGLAHAILLPVPPIYAGEFGPPGLIMEDCAATPDAPAVTRAALFEAAEADVIAAGAKVLLASSIPGGAFEAIYAENSYTPLTLYLSKTDLSEDAKQGSVQPANEADIPNIVTASAAHRARLDAIHPQFWKPHPEADTRFGNWMRRSLTLEDRDMFVAMADGAFQGYAISQPVTPLHIPAAHDISRTGIIDDFYDLAIADVDNLNDEAGTAQALLSAAEAALHRRGNQAALVVCPAGWTSKVALLEAAGYRTALTWHLKIID